MKIVMIATRDKFGLYAHTYHLIKELSKMSEIDLHVINLIDENDETSKIDSFGDFTVHYIDKNKNKFGLIRGVSDIISIRKKIIDINPEILHIQYVPYLSPIDVLLKNKYPIIFTVHSIYAIDEKMFEWVSFSRYIYRKILSILERIIIAKSLTNIIVAAPPMRDILINRTNAKIYIIPNGIDLEDIQDISSKSIGYHSSILYVGRLTKRKGVDVLLKAILIIKDSIPNILLYIIGEGPQDNELKEFVKELNICSNVKFLGFISENEKYSYYKHADICIVPSIDEPFGIVLLEAMACEKPIIASKVGGIPFIVEDGKTGILVEPGDVETLAEKIIMLLQNESLRKKMGKAGRKKIINFSWKAIAEQTVDVYRNVIKDYSKNITNLQNGILDNDFSGDDN